MQGSGVTSHANGHKAAKLLLALLFAIAVLSTGIAVAADSDGEQDAEVVSALSDPPAEPEGDELLGKRTATSETFALPDGSRETRVYSEPIHYRDENGDWLPIEEGLERAGAFLINGDSSFDAKLPRVLGAGSSHFSTDRGWVSERFLGGESKAAELNADGVATYEVDSATAFQLSTLGNGLKEEIVLADSSAPTSFKFSYTASNGVSATKRDDGSIRFANADDETVAELPAPTITDSYTAAIPSDAVHYELDGKGEGEWQLTVEVDRDWLEQPDRVWPARIDPTTELPNTYVDCTFGGKPGTPWGTACSSGGWKTLYGQSIPSPNPAQDYWARSVLAFNTTSIPQTAWIENASVSLNAPQVAKKTEGVQLRASLDPWSTGLTWLTYDGVHKWSGTGVVEGGSFAAGEPEAQVLTSQRGYQAGWWKFAGGSLQGLVQKWVMYPSLNYGLLLKLKDDKVRECDATKCNERVVGFDSGAAVDANNRPQMSILWYPSAPASSRMVTPTEGTRTAHNLKLKSAWTAAGISGVTYQWKLAGAGWQTIPTSLVKGSKGESITWPMAVKGKSSDPVYFDAAHVSKAVEEAPAPSIYVRALLDGEPGAGGYTAQVNAVIDHVDGNVRDATAQVGPGTLDLATGDFSVREIDVSIPTPTGSLEFARTMRARSWGGPNTSVLGWGWKPSAPVEANGASSWRKAEDIEVEEGSYTVLTDTEGGELPFEKTGEKTFETLPEAAGWILSRIDESHIALTEPSGAQTVFEKPAGSTEYVPITVSQAAGKNQARMVYTFGTGNALRLSMIVAPAPPDVKCDESPLATFGCRALVFTYANASKWKADSAYGDRLEKITYIGPGGSGGKGNWDVACYDYDTLGRMTAVWDPRVTPKPLKTTYAYTAPDGPLKTITPPGLQPWTMEYSPTNEQPTPIKALRLLSVSRPSLVGSPSVAKTTIAYNVPLGGGVTGLKNMAGTEVAKWGQEDPPVEATAIFPPDQVPSSPPSSYSSATVYYMDAESQLVNTASPAGAGTSEPSITTAEPDEFGNVTRELTPQNRVRALAAGAESVTRSRELETKRNFSNDGTQMEEEWGPLHQITYEPSKGVLETKQGRLHRVVQYDKLPNGEGITPPPAGTPMPHLPTLETTGLLRKEGGEVEPRAVRTLYDWTLRKPTDMIVDPFGLSLHTHVSYDPETGLQTERRLPGNPNGGDAHSTVTIYYTKGPNSLYGRCGNRPEWAAQPCFVGPAVDPLTSGLPKLKVTAFAYNQFGQMIESVEAPGVAASEAGSPARTTKITYDEANRRVLASVEKGGTSMLPTETTYDPNTGLAVEQKLVCGGCDTQALKTGYDSLGRPVSYIDADGSESTVTYDLLGRVVTASDGKGSQTRTYDASSGLLTQLQDSAAGIFTASYNADGALVEQGLPNGLVAQTTFDEVGAPTHLAYTKVTSCASNCTWLEFDALRSVEGRVLSQTSTLSTQTYSYDAAGRLKLVRDTPKGGSCTTRSYSFDADSNRTAMVTRAPGLGGACDTTSAGTSVQYSYDAADRLLGSGVSYDDFGRITALPASYAGGKALSTSYFSNDMVAEQTQGGVTNTFQLDALGRQRQRVQGGGLEGTEIFHYAGPGDSPAWTARGSAWTRSISGIGGELAAVQDSVSGTALQLTNLHGDVVGTASLSQSATKPTSTSEFDEFGNPKQAGSTRFGWLGGKIRRTELSSGVIQMGARSYVPAIGRFLTPDPIIGGSANAYDYANQDPVNDFDLEGTCSSKKGCQKARRQAEGNVRRKMAQLKGLVRQKRAESIRGLPGGVNFPRLPWEDDFNDVMHAAANTLNEINEHTSCTKGAFLANGGAYYIEKKSTALAEAGTKISGAATKLGETLGLLGLVLTGAAVFGAC